MITLDLQHAKFEKARLALAVVLLGFLSTIKIFNLSSRSNPS